MWFLKCFRIISIFGKETIFKPTNHVVNDLASCCDYTQVYLDLALRNISQRMYPYKPTAVQIAVYRPR